MSNQNLAHPQNSQYIKHFDETSQVVLGMSLDISNLYFLSPRISLHSDLEYVTIDYGSGNMEEHNYLK